MPPLDTLEPQIDTVDYERFETIYYRAELFSKGNRRNIMGWHVAQIQADAGHFQELGSGPPGC